MENPFSCIMFSSCHSFMKTVMKSELQLSGSKLLF